MKNGETIKGLIIFIKILYDVDNYFSYFLLNTKAIFGNKTFHRTKAAIKKI